MNSVLQVTVHPEITIHPKIELQIGANLKMILIEPNMGFVLLGVLFWLIPLVGSFVQDLEMGFEGFWSFEELGFRPFDELLVAELFIEIWCLKMTSYDSKIMNLWCSNMKVTL